MNVTIGVLVLLVAVVVMAGLRASLGAGARHRRLDGGAVSQNWLIEHRASGESMR